MRTEARQAHLETDHSYVYVHHKHHKQRRDYTPDGTVQIERDIEGVTIINTGYRHTVEDSVRVEYVRSPSASDKWQLMPGTAWRMVRSSAISTMRNTVR